MIGGLPPQPTFRHMFAGITLALIMVIAFLNIPIVLKYVGTALTFLPSKLGIIKVVSKSEVMPVDIHTTPTFITFTNPGNYLIYTDNYSLLTVNDAIITTKGRPWLNIQSDSGVVIQVRLIGRGMAIYDTPLARGRPVVSFNIPEPGVYKLAHPIEPINIFIVPDYLSGKERIITFSIYLELLVTALVMWTIIQRSRKKKNGPIRPKKELDIKNHSISGRS